MSFPKSRRPEFERKAAELAGAAYAAGFAGAMERLPQRARKTVELLARFADLYGEAPLTGSMIEPGLMLWRDYYEWTGDHWILTDDGWEPGEAKVRYVEIAKEQEIPLADLVEDEVNAPQDRQMTQIYK